MSNQWDIPHRRRSGEMAQGQAAPHARRRVTVIRRAELIAVLTIGFAFTLTGLAVAAETQGTLQVVSPVAGQIVFDNGSMLAVNEDTEIWVEDRQGSLADLQPGERIKATYDSEGDQNVASRIDVEPDGTSRSQISQGVRWSPRGQGGSGNAQ